jgi:hypothetical protein
LCHLILLGNVLLWDAKSKDLLIYIDLRLNGMY